ncbi:MAG TPA: OST-HTH/LOTUS domain-containing protein, partial [Myxococcales bacterium]|nr:OST-HTH/LOTUS domain-containing protein [Myxococcales bacterium]
VKACDEFIYLKPSAKSGQKAPREKVAKVIPEIAREVAAAILAKATGPVNPSFIKEAIVRKQPDFDEHDHGFSTFNRLLEAMEKEGLLKREQTAKGQWYVIPPEK